MAYTKTTKIVDGVDPTIEATVTASNALKVDGSGVTQPISGSVSISSGTMAATQSGTWNITNITGTVTLPTGASQEHATAGSPSSVRLSDGTSFYNVDTSALLLDATFTSRINTLGQKVMASSTPVVLSSDHSTISVSVTNFPSTQAVTQSGTWTVQPGNTANTTPWLQTISQGGNTATVSASGALKVDGSAVTQPVSGTVTANQGTPNSNINNAWPVSGSMGMTLSQEIFGSLLTAHPLTVFSSKEDLQQQTLLWSTLTATGGSIVYSSTTSSNTLAVTTSSGSRAVRQSKSYLSYSPGKGLRVLATGVIGSGQTNTVKRIGLYDDNNGLFFELSGTTKNVVVRNNAVDTAVSQSSWNIDKLDGTGVSGITIDWTKTQIFTIQFQWLGVGRIIFSFNIDGKDYACHQVLNANTTTDVYMRSPNLPVRYEIVNTGVAAGVSDLKQICSTIQVLGGIDPYGTNFSCNNGVTVKSISNTQITPLIILRPKSTVLYPPFRLKAMDLLSSTADNYYWELNINPTITGGTAASYTSVHANSYLEFDVAATGAVTGGHVLVSGFVSTASRSFNTLDLGDNLNVISSDISGTRDILVLGMRDLAGTGSMLGSINWMEFS